MKARRLLVPGIALAITTLAFAREARAANFAPACTGTTGDAAALITAITTSNANNEPDTITLMAGCTYELTTVNNTAGAGVGDNGLPVIQADGSAAATNILTIMGNGATIKRAAAAPAFRLIDVNGGFLNLTGVTLSGGNADTEGGGLTVLAGTVTLLNSTVSGNTSTSWGGGIQIVDGTLNIRSSTVSGNTTTSDSAGINVDGGIVVISNSTISGNSGPQQGGGIGNFAGDLTIVNSTIAGNTADEGGGVWSAASATSTKLTNTIIALNNAGPVADAGAGVDAGLGFAPDVGGFLLVDGGNNLIGDATGTPATFNVSTLKGTRAAKIDPLLAALANNGGLTLTRALGATSPALNAANPTVCAAAPVSGVDQRGTARPAACDIGSFELVGGTVSDASTDGSSADGSSGSDASSTTDSGTIPSDDSGTISGPDSGKTGGNDAGDDGVVPVDSSSCSCDNAGAPSNALGLSALVMAGALLVARRRRR